MIKKLLSCVEEYKKTTALSMFLVIFESFIEILIPTLMAIIIDEGISQGRTSVVWQLGVLLILLALLDCCLLVLYQEDIPLHPRVLLKTYVELYFLMYKNFLSPILINLQRLV